MQFILRFETPVHNGVKKKKKTTTRIDKNQSYLIKRFAEAENEIPVTFSEVFCSNTVKKRTLK